ncbi:thiamine pyrophosphate-binding protein [Nonomuraea sp. NPDC003707]
MTRHQHGPFAAIGAVLAELGVRTLFGTAASDGPHLADALDRDQVRFIGARHADGAAAMAVAHARISTHLTALLLNPDTGLSAALPGIVDAATSRTPLLVLAPLTRRLPHPGTLALTETALLSEAGVLVHDLPDLRQARTVLADAARAAAEHQRPVLVRIALDEQHGALAPLADRAEPVLGLRAMPVADPSAVEELAALLGRAVRPVFIVGRGGIRAAEAIESLAEQAGALLATSAAAHGLFRDNPWHIGIAGMLATPDMADLLAAADVVVSWGCSLDAWTTRYGTLLAEEADLVQIDINPAALGLHQSIDLGVAGDAERTAQAIQQVMPSQQGGQRTGQQTGFRTEPVRDRIAAQASWHDIGYQPLLELDDRVDPRTVSMVLDTILPAERTLIAEPTAILGYPISYLRVPDADGCLLAPLGLGLASGIGAALARPDRLVVAALDVDAVLTAAAELETAARLRLPLLIAVYDQRDPASTARPTVDPDGEATRASPDLTQIAAGHGCTGVVIRRPADLTVLSDWPASAHRRPLLLHIMATQVAWWLNDRASTPTPGRAR